MIRHLYVHFPFCARICPYCAFYKTRGNAAEVARFCEALASEARRIAKKIPLTLETIFFGGGTPTVLSAAQLKNLLELFHEIFDLGELREWSIEANPGSVSVKKAAALRESGVNRISLGVQSWDNELLHLLGREHDAAQAEESFHIFRGAGFSNRSHSSPNIFLPIASPMKRTLSFSHDSSAANFPRMMKRKRAFLSWR